MSVPIQLAGLLFQLTLSAQIKDKRASEAASTTDESRLSNNNSLTTCSRNLFKAGLKNSTLPKRKGVSTCTKQGFQHLLALLAKT